jgi:toxin ParE1/3/4
MASFRFSRKAKADLKAIARYTEREWGREQRNHYLRQFDQSFRMLAENPQLGKTCDAILSGYRQQPHGSHIIFYRHAADGEVEIIRILHKRMLPQADWLLG